MPTTYLGRRISAVLLATLVLQFVGLTHSQRAFAEEPAAWHDGPSEYSQVLNCTSVIVGSPYVERGIGAHTGYYADLDSGRPTVGEHTHLRLVVAGLGNPCGGGTYFWPEFSLPEGVEWYKRADIVCYYNSSRMTGADCPQWTNLLQGQGQNGSDSYAREGNTWGVPQGGTFEFLLPIWAPQQPVNGGTATVYLHTADGNSNPTLVPTAPLFFFPPAQTCAGRIVTVDLARGDLPTSAPDVIIGTPRADRILSRGGNDIVCAGGGNDVVNGGPGGDSLLSGTGRDRLDGSSGSDRCDGGPGRDIARRCESRWQVP